YFQGKIHHVTKDPISILIDAAVYNYENPELEKSKKYRGIIVQKSTYGLFVDLGLHFNWRFGSLLGLIHRSALTNETDYDRLNAGENIITKFQGCTKDGKLILGKKQQQGKWEDGTLDKLVDTIQNATVVKDEDNHKMLFYVAGEHKAKAIVNKAIYSDSKSITK